MEAAENKNPLIRRHLISTEVYQQMIEIGVLSESDRVELIHGEIIDMSPVNSQHVTAVNLINRFFTSNFNENTLVSIQNPIMLGDYSQPEPDIALLKLKSDFYQNQIPGADDILLVMEVANSSLAYDQTIKASLYATAGILYYWIINLNDRCLELYEQPKQQQYSVRRLYYPGETVPCPPLNAEIAVNELFV